MIARNMNLALRYLFSALENARGACARTRQMVSRAIARFLELSAMIA
jgi:hypothetical protein